MFVAISFHLVDDVTYGRQRMMKYHSWTHVSHYGSYLVPVGGRIAVNLAFAAIRLVVAFRTTVKTVVCIGEQLRAIVA